MYTKLTEGVYANLNINNNEEEIYFRISIISKPI